MFTYIFWFPFIFSNFYRNNDKYGIKYPFLTGSLSKQDSFSSSESQRKKCVIYDGVGSGLRVNEQALFVDRKEKISPNQNKFRIYIQQ